MSRDPMEVLAEVARALEQCGVPYLVGGSVASSQYGMPRSTQDVDLVADLRLEHIDPLVAALENDYYIDAGMIRESIEHRSSFNIIHLVMVHKVDIFIATNSSWGRQQMARRRMQQMGERGSTFYVCSPEDIVLSKLDWYRQGGEISDRQWGDVLGVLKVQATELEFDYLRHWAHELAVAELLEEAIREAGLM